MRVKKEDVMASSTRSKTTAVFDKETIQNNAFLMTLTRGCISSYVMATFFDVPFPITLDNLLEEYGQNEIEIFYKDKETVESILGNCGVEEFNSMTELVEATLESIESIVFAKSYDIDSV
jgi:hypothetical protein